MPINPLPVIEQYESGGRNIQQQAVPSSVSTASGYYQITNTTWNSVVAPATGLPAVGPGTSNPDGVMDLSAAQQQQGASALFSAQGFNPWTCSGCNSQLAAYVQLQGGPGAFAINSASPATATVLPGGVTAPLANTGSFALGSNVPSGPILDNIVQQFQQQASQIQPAIYNAALDLFGYLALISIAVAFISMLWRTNFRPELGDVFGELVRQMLSLGLVFWLLTNSLTLSKDILESFQKLAVNTGAQLLTPSTVMGVANSAITSMLQQLSWHIGADLAILWFAVPAYACLVVIAAWMVLIMCETYFTVAGSAIFISIGGLWLSREVVFGFVRYIVAVGVKLMMLMILASVGINMINGFVQQVNNLSASGAAVIFGTSLVLVILCVALPRMFANIIVGAATTGMEHSHARGAVMSAFGQLAGAAALATGEIALAAQSIKAAAENLKQATEEGNAPKSGIGRAAMMVGNALRTNAGARAQDMAAGMRIGGRGGSHSWRSAQFAANERRVRAAEGAHPNPPSANQS